MTNNGRIPHRRSLFAGKLTSGDHQLQKTFLKTRRFFYRSIEVKNAALIYNDEILSIIKVYAFVI